MIFWPQYMRLFLGYSEIFSRSIHTPGEKNDYFAEFKGQ